VVYELYERQLLRGLRPDQMPKHVGVIVDGNRRWARAFGALTPSGYQAGAGKISEFLGWCDDLGVEVVTLWLLSTDNLGRPDVELQPLLAVIERLASSLALAGQWRYTRSGRSTCCRPRPPRSSSLRRTAPRTSTP
jgi:short-chain Z-isoprenyl diphosphate synthase